MQFTFWPPGMPHALCPAHDFFKNKSGLEKWDKVCMYACMMRVEKGVYVHIKVTSKTSGVLEKNYSATRGYLKTLKKFDTMFTWLKKWCERLAHERDVQAVEFEIVTPTNERKFLGRHVNEYTLPSKKDQTQRYIKWAHTDKQNTESKEEVKAEEA